MDMKKLLSIVDGQAKSTNTDSAVGDMKKFVSIVNGSKTTQFVQEKAIIKESAIDSYVNQVQEDIKEKKQIIDEEVTAKAKRVADKLKEKYGLSETKKSSKKKPDANKDGIPDYAQDGKGSKDLGKGKKPADNDGEEKETKGLSVKQKKLPAGLQKAIAAKKGKKTVKESIATMLTKMSEDIEAMKEYLNQLDERVTIGPDGQIQGGIKPSGSATAPAAAQPPKKSSVEKYTPGVTYPAAYTISYNGNQYKFAGRDADGPGTGEMITVGAGAIGIRGLAPTKIELGRDGMYYLAGQ